jgi:hypothetical protein
MNLKCLVFLYTIWLANSWGNFCSVICGTSCNGDLKTNCNNCQSDGAWTPSGGNSCTVKTSANWTYLDSTPDLGGGINVAGASLLDTCYDFQLYGYINPSQQITIATAGITVPYYAMRIYFGILALDSNCNGCPNPYSWDSTAAFSVLFNDPQAT